MHFGTLEASSDRRRLLDDAGVSSPSGQTTEVYLSIQNPVRIEDQGDWTVDDVYTQVREQVEFTPEERKSIEQAVLSGKNKAGFEALKSALNKHGTVRNRADVVAALQEAGLEVPRQGRDYLTALDPTTGDRWRLKGELYAHDFQRERLDRAVAETAGERTRGALRATRCIPSKPIRRWSPRARSGIVARTPGHPGPPPLPARLPTGSPWASGSPALSSSAIMRLRSAPRGVMAISRRRAANHSTCCSFIRSQGGLPERHRPPPSRKLPSGRCRWGLRTCLGAS